MKNKVLEKMIYIKLLKDENKVITFGITSEEFIMYNDINNILLLKSEFFGNAYNTKYNFELLENQRNILDVLNDVTNQIGDLCFIDYNKEENINKLSIESVLHMLYFSHSTEKLELLFDKELNNNYAYYCHDNGWYSKIYYRNISTFIYFVLNMLKDKLNIGNENHDKDNFEILENILSRGALINISSNQIKIYIIGDYDNFDDICNNYNEILDTNNDIYDVNIVNGEISIIKEW